jgi:hypothetical protein
VEKRDAEPCQGNGGENRFVHEPRIPIIIRTIREHGEKTSPLAAAQSRMKIWAGVFLADGKDQADENLPASGAP